MIDSKNVIGRGWRFPVRPDAAGRLTFLGSSLRPGATPGEGDEKIRQSIWLLLSTAPGERLMLPEFGCGIHDLVFTANTAAVRGVIQAHVRDSLLRWEPRIDVLDVVVDSDPQAANILHIRIDYRIRANNSLYNLVYPFFINEGVG